jgi:hypothetical protein
VRRPLTPWLAATALLLAAGAYANDVYRWVDETGTVHYGDRPGNREAERITLVIDRPASAARAASPPPRRTTGSPAESAPQPVVAEPPEPSAREQREQQAAACQEARQRLETFTTARRLYRVGEDGEREYLSDAELEEARAQAAAEVERLCD